MPPPSISEIATAVGLTVPAFFSDALDQVLQGEANYIATGEPTGAVAQIGQAVARAACRRYAAGADVSASAAERYERACGPYLETLSPGNALGVGNPFQGGQCAVRYDVLGTYVSNDQDFGPCGATRQWSAIGLPGPVSGITRGSFGPTPPWQISGGGFTFICTDVASNRQLLDISDCGPSVGPNVIRASRPVITSANRQDGLPDDCGNPPPVVTPRPPTTDPIGTPFRFNPIPGVDVGVDVTLNPDGSITFDVGTGDVTIDPFSDGGGGGPATPGDETDPGAPGTPGDTGSGGNESGEAGDGQELVGLLVAVLSTPENPNTFDNNPNTVYRGVGYVRMGYPGRLGLDISGGTVLAPQFFHAPQRGLTSWAVSANLGFNLRVTPYYRTLE